MILGYARVSTDTQETALQLDALKKAGADRIFEETASGARDDRPQLMRLLDIARPGDTIIVWKIDRLGRSLVHLVQTVNMLHERGVQLRSLTENLIDTTSPTGKLTFGIFALLAEFERDMLRQRVNAGLTAARARGRVGGRKKVLTPDQITSAGLLIEQGIPRQDVAKQFGVNRHTLWRAMKEGPHA